MTVSHLGVSGRLTAFLLAGILAGSLFLASKAFGVTEHFCTGTLPHMTACGSPNAHGLGTTANMYVELTVNHTGCAGYGYGFGGYVGLPANAYDLACTSGAGTNGGCIQIINYSTHGVLLNHNSTTDDSVSDAHLTYPASC